MRRIVRVLALEPSLNYVPEKPSSVQEGNNMSPKKTRRKKRPKSRGGKRKIISVSKPKKKKPRKKPELGASGASLPPLF